MAPAGYDIDLIQTSAWVGAVMPLLAAILKQDRLSPRTNTGIAIALAVVAAVFTAAASQTLDGRNAATSFTVVYTTAVAFYHGLWKPTGIAPALQTRTSRTPVRPMLVVVRSGQREPRRDISRC